MVDHHFANASQGAIGLIIDGAPGRSAEISSTTTFPPPQTPTDPDAVHGKLAFECKCLACHSIGGGDKLGPDLAGVTKRRNDAWLTRWLKSPEQMLQTDPDAQGDARRKYNNIPMPNQNLSDAEIKQYLAYFHWFDAQPPGSVKSGAGGH